METSSDPFSTTVERVNGDVVVALLGELDLDTAPDLARVLEPYLDEGPPGVVIECSRLDFIDSSGIAVLLGAQTRLKRRGACLTVRSLKAHALKIFATLGLIEFLDVETEPANP